jgi:hypothetical protein
MTLHKVTIVIAVPDAEDLSARMQIAEEVGFIPSVSANVAFFAITKSNRIAKAVKSAKTAPESASLL